MKPDFTPVWVSLAMLASFAGVAYLITGSETLALLFGVISFPVSTLMERCRQQEQKIATLERRMLIVEEEKASGEWVANVDQRRERDREFFERQIQGIYEPSRSA